MKNFVIFCAVILFATSGVAAEDLAVKNCEIFRENIKELNLQETRKLGPEPPVSSDVDCASLNFNMTLHSASAPLARTGDDFFEAVQSHICSERSDWTDLFASGWTVKVGISVKSKDFFEVGKFNSCP